MSRPARIAALAVLIALSVAAQAGAQLDPARVFNPNSESLLAALSAPRSVSFVTASIFNERVASADLFLSSPGYGAQSAGFGEHVVTFNLPQTQATFEPAAGELAYNAPAVPVPAMASPLAAPADSATLRIPTAPPIPDLTQSEQPRFGSYVPYAPALVSQNDGASVPVRLGSVHFETAFHAMQLCGTADEAAACRFQSETEAQTMTAGTAFNVRAGSRNLNVSLESGVSHTVNQVAGVFPYVPLDPDAQAGLSYPGVSDVFAQNVGAQVAVPVTPHVTVGLQFDRVHYQGNGVSSELPGFQGMRDTYLGNLTYQLPNRSSAITLSARQYRYQDLLTPNLNLTQTRADLDFTVKF